MIRNRNQSGFSMIELLVGITILTIGMLAIGTMLTRSSETSIFSNQLRTGDIFGMELMEAVKGEAATSTFTELQNLRLRKPYASSLSRMQYEDAATSTTGTVGTSGQYVERTGTGQGYIYKWRVEDRRQELQYPDGLLKVEVTVGWDNCTSADPESCKYKSKLTNFVIQSRN